MALTEPDVPYLEIARIVREEIEDGQYRPGEALPSSRTFAQRGYAPRTVDRAYKLLADEGYVTLRFRREPIVRNRAELKDARHARARERIRECLRLLLDDGYTRRELRAMTADALENLHV